MKPGFSWLAACLVGMRDYRRVEQRSCLSAYSGWYAPISCHRALPSVISPGACARPDGSCAPGFGYRSRYAAENLAASGQRSAYLLIAQPRMRSMTVIARNRPGSGPPGRARQAWHSVREASGFSQGEVRVRSPLVAAASVIEVPETSENLAASRRSSPASTRLPGCGCDHHG